MTAVSNYYQQGLSALQNRQPSAARQAFSQAIGRGDSRPAVLLGMALACHASRDIPAAIDYIDQALVSEPDNLSALILKGDILVSQNDTRLALQCYQRALDVGCRQETLPPDLVQALQRIQSRCEGMHREIQQQLTDYLQHNGFKAELVPARFNQALAMLTGHKQPYFQAPRAFFYPELPHRQFFEREEFDWLPALEAQTESIAAELEQVLASREGFSPYIQREHQGPAGAQHSLLDDKQWSALFLIKDGVPEPGMAQGFPRTLQALEKVPLCRVKSRGPMVLFSLLESGAHIKPHHGFYNTRLICHLPLIVPGDGALRVGNETRNWQKGEALVFDDSIEHEAWNHSDHPRVVLIFDIWRPELSEQERHWISCLLEAAGQAAPSNAVKGDAMSVETG